MSFLRIENLSKTFGNHISAVDNLTMEVEKGEFLVLLGPSGCGKSTLLRLIAGLEQPSGGEIFIENNRMSGTAPKNRNIAMVFQEYALYPHMTVRENLAFPLKMKKVLRSEIDFAVEKTAELIGLTELLNRKPKQLSGGQRQRVALGRALIREPKLFLFDEPLSNLDFNLRLNLRWEIAELQKKTGITSIYVTHDQQEAMALGHRIGILNNGELIQCCSPDELYKKPANLFIARFIGIPQINILEGSLDENLILKTNGNSSSVDLRKFKFLSQFKNKKCKIGIRAHNIIASEIKADKHEMLELQSELSRIENQGDYYLGEFSNNHHTLVVKLPDKGNLKLNSLYHLKINPAHILLFNDSKGERIYPE
ncbi:MAG: ABC transporter ATP-binding protein [candidate division Zixibacteria bacterium]|nr:ABC transporter ATP-binding protein [candidate division Zixibacteria bacterium]